MSYGKVTKKKKPAKKPSGKSTAQPQTSPWDKIKTFPVAMFHTFRGPLMGHVDPSIGKNTRIWAPCMPMRNPADMKQVYFLPLEFVEDFVDLAPNAMVGRSAVPIIVVEAYATFVEEFIKGSYMMKPIAMTAGVEGPKEAHAPNTQSGSQEPVACRACGQVVSSPLAHFPVLFDSEGKPLNEQAVADLGEVPETGHWECEIHRPEIRTDFPDYVPPPTEIGTGKIN